MRKGISPIVAVVLLIAIAVIAAVGLYFWVGGLATKQPTPTTPITISAQRVTCNTTAGNVTLLVQNLAASGDVTTNTLVVVDGTGAALGTAHDDITSGSQATVTLDPSTGTFVAGTSYVVMSTEAGVAQATFVC